MINLIKNELIKILKRKVVYVMLIITVIVIILNMILIGVSEDWFSESNIDEEISFYESELAEIDKTTQKEDYADYYSSLEALKLIKEYGEDTWQEYIINNELTTIIYDMAYYEDDKTSDEYIYAKEEYDEIIELLDSGDWQYFAKAELANLNVQLSSVGLPDSEKEILEIKKQIIEWRLEKNIPYGTGNLNEYLSLWEAAKYTVANYEESMKSGELDFYQETEYKENIETIKLCEYAIENGIDSKVSDGGYLGSSTLEENATTFLETVFSNNEIFIILLVIILAGTTVSSEFNKGTIKLLLARPYKRTKILISKFVSCLIVLLGFVIAIVFAQFIIVGIAYGFGSYFADIPVYNFNTESIEVVNIISYIAITFVAKLPMYILLMTLAFLIGTVFLSSVLAIAVPIIGYMFTETINSFGYIEKIAKYLRFFVTPNWDLTSYLWGGMPDMQFISLGFSIVVCLVYFAVMMFISVKAFKSKDVKNV